MANRSAFAGGVLLLCAVLGGTASLFDLGDRLFPAQKPIVPDPGPVVEPMSTPAPEAPMETQLRQRAEDVLASNACRDLEVGLVSVVMTVTPAAETTSGFDGYYLEGEAELRAGDRAERLRLLGTGKGPAGEIQAQQMAIRGLEDQLLASDDLSVFCKED